MSTARVIGIDAGGTKVLAGVVGEDLRVERRVRRLFDGCQRDVLDTIAGAVEEARAAVPDVEALGFGIPSLVDRRTGSSTMSVHLPLENVPFRDLMAERFGLPVYVDNDANAAVLAEQRRGAAKGASYVVLLTLGTGIGGGVIVGGEVYRGSTGAGAELGHMVVDLDGEPCAEGCPGRGCLETVASGRAIGREGALVARRSPDSGLGEALAKGRGIDGELVSDLAVRGDPAAQEALAAVGRRLGMGIASLINAFDPEVVVVGGGAAAAGELLLGPAREVMAERALMGGRGSVRLVAARFGGESGMIGAALMALEGEGLAARSEGEESAAELESERRAAESEGKAR